MTDAPSPRRGDAHAELKRDILVALGARPECRLTGRTAVGQAADPRSGQHVLFGLWVGASDVLGIVKPRGRWLALEVKTGKGRLSKEQGKFLAMINAMGGVGREVRSVEAAEAALVEAMR